MVLSHLNVWAPEPTYMFAMKCLSSRLDSSDGDDIKFLAKHLRLTEIKQAFEIIEKYYPKNQIGAKTQFFLEEIFENI